MLHYIGPKPNNRPLKSIRQFTAFKRSNTWYAFIAMATSSSPSSSSSSSSDALIQTLTNNGWCFQQPHQIKTLIETKFSVDPHSTTIASIESELCNTDLRAIGGKSLTDPSTLRKSTHFQGPKVLQVSSARDISRSSIAESSGGSSSKRLLRLKLTDGHSDVTAIEFSYIPSLPDNVVPGTKIRLENKVVVHSGILCLNAKVVTVLGGIVPSLYEEWEMNQKYAGFTRSTLKLAQGDDIGGPPPFQKFQTGPPSRRINQQSRSSENSKATVKAYGVTGPLQTSRDQKANSRGDNVKPGSLTEKTEEKQPVTEAGPKEVAELVPVQNQAAAQKLLQKMSNSNRIEGHSRGWKQRGRGKEDNESAVLTLDEWERKRANVGSSLRQGNPNVNQDDLARQLQNQFDLEDFHDHQGQHVTEADDIRMSMFSFERDDPTAQGRGEFRGRGRGRGRRRGRGRGRGG